MGFLTSYIGVFCSTSCDCHSLVLKSFGNQVRCGTMVRKRTALWDLCHCLAPLLALEVPPPLAVQIPATLRDLTHSFSHSFAHLSRYPCLSYLQGNAFSLSYKEPHCLVSRVERKKKKPK